MKGNRHIKQLSKVTISRIQETTIQSGRPSIHWLKDSKSDVLQLVALLPVWNAERWLPDTLAALAESVDGIIALDDGSDDNSLAILKQNALVIEVIEKPKKRLSEWNDAQNHFELYLAAGKYHPEWLVFIDADEILEHTFKIFRHYLLSVSENIKAFAFHVAEMDGGLIVRKKFAHRMFRYKEGYSFDNKRLHCRPLPLEITLDEIRLINVRLLHAADEMARKFRFAKYMQADPNLQYQTSYEHLLYRFSDEEITSMGGQLLLENVTEDGLQRRIRVRRIKRFNKLVLNDTRINEIIKMLYNNLKLVEGTFEFFLKLNLDAYLIGRPSNKKLVAQYSFDSTKDVFVTTVEAWLIEEMHHHRDFFLTVARLHLIEKSNSLQDSITRFAKLLETLVRKGVLKLK